MIASMPLPAPDDSDSICLSRSLQTVIGFVLMFPWPLGAALIQPLGSPSTSDFDYVIYVVGLFWVLLWDPIAAVQGALSPAGLTTFTAVLVIAFCSLWLTVAALPLLGRWPGRQVIGLWSLQSAYAGAQAIAGFYYAKNFV